MLFKKEKEPVYIPTLDSVEQRLVVRGLVELKEKQIRENKSYYFIDSLIVKSCDSEVTEIKPKQWAR